MVRKVTIIFAHYNYSASRIQKALLNAIRNLDNVEIRDLYQLYPDYFIDVKNEQQAILTSDLIIFQHPINWYSSPAIIKEWQDVVLEHGFAYGTDGNALRGKDFIQVVSSGGGELAFKREGTNRFTLGEFLRPFEATARLCGLNYHKPFIVNDAFKISDALLAEKTKIYRDLLEDYLKIGNSALISEDTSNIGI